MKNASTIILLAMFSFANNIFSQDWSVSINDTEKFGKDWILKFGRIPTSENYLISSQRLLNSTRYQRLPVGLYGWGGQMKYKFDDSEFVFDITSDRDIALKDSFEGFEIGTRL